MYQYLLQMPPVAGGRGQGRPRRHSAPAGAGRLPRSVAAKAAELLSKPAVEETSMTEEMEALKVWLHTQGTGVAFLDDHPDPPDPAEQQEHLAQLPFCERTRACLAEWTELGTASQHALSMIKRGLFINLEATKTGKYEEPNNKTFESNPAFGESAIDELVANGSVHIVKKDEIRCINPLSVAKNAKNKLRLCLDLSRFVNRHTKCKKVALNAVPQFADTVRKGDHMVTFDLSSAFHHIKIAPCSRKLLGFKFRRTKRGKISKRWTYGVYAALPFGWRRSTEKLLLLTKPVLQSWLQAGILALIYVDDGIGYARTYEDMKQKAARMLSDLMKLGLAVAWKKSDWEPKTRMEWCGLVWDTQSFVVSVPVEKTGRFHAAIQSLKDKSTGKVPVRDIASTVGKIVSCGRALGKLALFQTRSLTLCVAEAVKKVGWQGSARLTDTAVRELDYWLKNFRTLATRGQPIRRPASATVIKGIKLATDAGENYMGCVWFTSKDSATPKREFQLEFSQEEAESTSSTYRELTGILEGLRDSARLLKGQKVTLLTDNKAAEKSVAFGSMVECQQARALEIWELCSSFEIDLQVLWSRRSEREGKAADRITRTWEAGQSSFKTEFRITQADFDRIGRHTGISCQLDVLSSHWSKRLPRFYSEYHTPGAEARDAFAARWPTNTEMWIHAEDGQLLAIIEKARQERAKGLLLTALLPGSVAVTRMMEEIGPNFKILLKMKFDYESPFWRRNTCFTGRSSFDNVVVRFNFTGRR